MSNLTRLPITLFVDEIDFEPHAEFSTKVIRTTYDLELTEIQALKIIQGLQKRLDNKLPGSIRIRIIGRLVSQ